MVWWLLMMKHPSEQTHDEKELWTRCVTVETWNLFSFSLSLFFQFYHVWNSFIASEKLVVVLVQTFSDIIIAPNVNKLDEERDHG